MDELIEELRKLQDALLDLRNTEQKWVEYLEELA